jgi:serine/threonine-protein kinase PknK
MARAVRPETLPDRILDAAIEIAGAERGFLIVRAGTSVALAQRAESAGDGEAPPGWEVVAARNIDRENVKKALRKVSRSITSQVLESGVAFRSDDAVNDDALNPRQSVTDLKLRSVLCVPMRVGDEVRGCLYVDNRFAQGQFDDAAQELLEAFADQAALSLERVRLLEENARVLRSLEVANEELKGALAEQAKALDSLSEGFVPSGLELRHKYASILGRGRAITAMLTVVDRITDGDFPVLLYGESGTGKELVGRALHENGPRRDKPFVGVNCGAIAEGLLESELFGAVKGAYTGAVKDRPGLIESCQGGVLFLDEIGEMSLSLQAKLLRVLQEKRLRRVGGNEEIPVDVRVISATHRDLAREVAAGRFREDLYYRLKVVQVEVPPLRERREDIPVLVDAFLTRLHEEQGRGSRAAAADARMPRAADEPRLAGQRARAAERDHAHVRARRRRARARARLAPVEVAARRRAGGRARAGGTAHGRCRGGADPRDARADRRQARRGRAILGIPRRTFYNRLKALGIEP